MKKLIPPIAAALALLAANADAASVSFTNSATAAGDGVDVDLALGKFDTGLGTLTGVTVTVNFTTLAGSFSVQAVTATAANTTAANARVTIQQAATNSLGFSQLGESSFGVSTTPSLPNTVPGFTTQAYNITSTNVFVGSSQNINSGFWAAYQSAGGLGSVVFQVKQDSDIRVSGGTRTIDANAFTAQADMTVTYDYEAAPVPEPGTWAVGLLLASGAAFGAYRRRKAGKVAA